MKDTYIDADTDQPSGTGIITPNDSTDPVAKDRAKQVQQGYGAMSIAVAMAGGYREGGKPGRVVTAAKLFCILFAFLVPSLLMIDVALD